jgi:hypothetical protein
MKATLHLPGAETKPSSSLRVLGVWGPHVKEVLRKMETHQRTPANNCFHVGGNLRESKAHLQRCNPSGYCLRSSNLAYSDAG